MNIRRELECKTCDKELSRCGRAFNNCKLASVLLGKQQVCYVNTCRRLEWSTCGKEMWIWRKGTSGAGVLHVELSLEQSGGVLHVAVGRLISMGGSVQHVWEIYINIKKGPEWSRAGRKKSCLQVFELGRLEGTIIAGVMIVVKGPSDDGGVESTEAKGGPVQISTGVHGGNESDTDDPVMK